MDIKDFVEKSRGYLSKDFLYSSHDLNDHSLFGTIKEPIDLSNTSFSVHYLNRLTGYKPSEKVNQPVLYTFFLLVPPNDVKEKFIETLKKKKAGLEYDNSVIGQYYLPVTPGNNDFEELTNDLIKILNLNLFPGRDYKFSLHLVCLTADFNFSLIFIENNSVLNLAEQYKEGIPFDIC